MTKRSQFTPFYFAGATSLVVFLVSLALNAGLSSCVSQRADTYGREQLIGLEAQPLAPVADTLRAGSAATSDSAGLPRQLRTSPLGVFYRPGRGVRFHRAGARPAPAAAAHAGKIKIKRGANVVLVQGPVQGTVRQDVVGKNKGNLQQGSDSATQAVASRQATQQLQQRTIGSHQLSVPPAPAKPTLGFWGGLVAKAKALGRLALACLGGLLVLALLVLLLWLRRRKQTVAQVADEFSTLLH